MLGLVFGLVLGRGVGLELGLVLGLSFGLTHGLLVELVEHLNDAQPTDPRHPVQDDLAYGLTVGLILGLILWLSGWLMDRLVWGFSRGLASKLAFMLVFGMVIGLYWRSGAGRRYLVFLLCIRGRLPWRLGTFLNWAYEAGLLRISGVAYQFRHRELQDWLTAHPTP
ncbi:hypothetical protein [Streptomyces sp. ME109]|uniref:hypothetical protein n=1 Tax=Streptomyces sp. me109 TaxID=1827853 RepID=UPI0011CDE8AA|nr:hypothetical protein [Streptomyces sp. me109]